MAAPEVPGAAFFISGCTLPPVLEQAKIEMSDLSLIGLRLAFANVLSDEI